MSKHVAVVLLGMLVLMQSSCFVLKKHAKTTVGGQPVTSVIPPADSVTTLPSDSAAALKKEMIAALFPLVKGKTSFKTFSAKTKINFEGRGQKQDVTAHIRMKKDSVIWASVSALGGVVQVARVLITPDTIRLINYLERQVMTLPMSEVSKLLPAPADFQTLQSFILGDVLRSGGIPTDAMDAGDMLVLQTKQQHLLQQFSFSKADSSLRLLQISTADPLGPSGAIQLASYQLISGRKFPSKRAVSITNNNERFYLELEFSNVDFDKDIEFPFSIPRNYTRK